MEFYKKKRVFALRWKITGETTKNRGWNEQVDARYTIENIGGTHTHNERGVQCI